MKYIISLKYILITLTLLVFIYCNDAGTPQQHTQKQVDTIIFILREQNKLLEKIKNK